MPEPQPVQVASLPNLGQLFSNRRTSASTNSTSGSSEDIFSGLMRQASSITQQVSQTVFDPRAVSLARIGTENPDLAALFLTLGMSGNVDIQRMNRQELELIVNNLGLLQRTGFLAAIRNDINDPRFEAFLSLRSRNSELADSLANLFVRAITTENFGVNDITRDELLLVANNIGPIEQSGLLSTIRNDLPTEVNQILTFRENNPGLFNAAVRLGNTFPSLVDFGRNVANNPSRGYVTAAVGAAGALCFGFLSFKLLPLAFALPALLPALAIGAVIGLGIGALVSKLF